MIGNADALASVASTPNAPTMTTHPAVSVRVVPQRCVLILPSTAEFDSRTYRIASTLAGRGHDVHVIARLAPGLPALESHPAGYRIIRVPVADSAGLPAPLRRIANVRAMRGQWNAGRRAAPAADLVHAMALMGIPIGLALGRRDTAPVVYDARDIYVDAGNLARLPWPARALVARFERRWARQASRIITVNEPYAEVMAERFGVPKPLVVMNCAIRREPRSTRPRRFHESLGLDPATPIVLYHGGFSPDRGIEQLIAALPAVPGAALVLMGYGPLQRELHRRAAEPELAGRLHVVAAVSPMELLDWVASADVVAMPIQPSTLNHRLTTPNKLFEAMAAGVPVVASDLPGMAAIVRETGCGVLVDPTDPSAIAAAIGDLLRLPTEERAAIGRRGSEAHRATYNWEAQAAVLLGEYGRLTGKPW